MMKNFNKLFFLFCLILFTNLSKAQISGTVFRDYNNNGVRNTSNPIEPLANGVIVNVYNASDAIIASYTTSGTTEPNFSIPASGTAYSGILGSNTGFVANAVSVRLEYIFPSSFINTTSGFAGTGSGTSVRFATSPATNQNLGVFNRNEFFIDNPNVLVPKYQHGFAASTAPTLSIFPYNYASDIDGNINGTVTGTSNPPYNVRPNPIEVATLGEIGTIYGVAWRASQQRLYLSAYLRRKAPFGPNGPGAIYRFDNPTSLVATPRPSLFVDINTVFAGNPAGTLARPTNGSWDNETDVTNLVGKMGWGDIEVNNNQDTLYGINLNDRQLYAIPTTGTLNSTTIKRYDFISSITSLTGVTGFVNSNIRPFAVGVNSRTNNIYIGGVYSGEGESNNNNLRMLVWEFNPSSGVANLILNQALTFSRTNTADWRRWQTVGSNPTDPIFSMPMLTDIAFDGDVMLLAFRDRYGDVTPGTGQAGNVPPYPRGMGDMLRVNFNGTNWVLENNGSSVDGNTNSTITAATLNPLSGPGGAEFYFEDRAGDNSTESIMGSMLIIPGKGTVMVTAYDPVTENTAGQLLTGNFNTNGVSVHSNTNGVYVGAYDVIEGDDNSTTGLFAYKTNGLGDIVVLGTTPNTEIGNRVWNDANGDGIQNPGEAPIANVALEIFVDNNNDGIPDGAAIGTTTTNASGEWYFNNSNITGDADPNTAGVQTALTPDVRYIIRPAASDWTGGVGVGDLAGLQLTKTDKIGNGQLDLSDNDASLVGATPIPQISVLIGAAGQNNHTLDFGFKALASIGDKVWRDDDKDGIQDAGEPGVAGITVTLYQNGPDGIPGNADDIVVGTTVTDAYGNYLFDNLAASTNAATSYNVGFTLPANYQFTTQTNTQITGTSDATNTTTVSGGSTSANGSDANISTGRTGSFWLAPGEAERGVDAGIVFNTPAATNSIGNRVWLDTDLGGDQDANEPGVAGVTVTLYAADGITIVATTVTDVNGNYLFTGLLANTNYIVGVTPPAGTMFTTSGGTTPANDTDSDINANTASPTFGRTTVINTGAAGTATLTIDAGLIPQPTSRASLGDRVWYDNNRDGVQDPGEPGIAGVTVQLLAADGVTVLATTTTDAFGNYIFPNLLPGDYRVGFGPVAGMQRTILNSTSGTIPDATDSDADVTSGVTTGYRLVAGEKNMSVDAGYYSTQPAANVGALGDKVWNDLDGDGIQDANEPGVAGVTVTLYNSAGTAIATTTTDINGNYLFPNLTPGNYSVGFSNLPAGFGFTGQDKGGNDVVDSDANPATGRTAQVAVVGGATNTTLDAGIRQGNNSGLGSLGDRVWYDLDNDGIQDAGELGVAGVTVTLRDAGPDGILGNGDDGPTRTTTTNALGEYLFDGLNAGNYVVDFSNLPAGFTVSTQNAGANDNADSDGGALGTGGAPAGTSRTGVISLAQGEDNLSVDLGIVPPANTNTLGGTVWFDTDSDGQQAGNPARVPGVLVTLYNSAGVAIATTTTDENGDYLFVGLANGDYSVGFTNYPAGYDVTAREGTNTAAGGSDPDRVSGRTTTVTLNGANRDDRTLDAGLVSPRAALGNYVWDDLDRDGIQDAGETPVAGVTVSLYFDANNDGSINGAEATTPVATAITDADGRYFFPNLTPGNYQVGFTTLPTGMEFTTQDNTTGPNGDGVNSNGVGGDSDVSPTTGRTGIINLSPNEVDLTVDAGIRVNLPATIGNRVWADIDTDGVQDAGEPGIAGVLVTLYNSSNQPIGSAVTDGNGNWQITNVPTGTGYYVIFTSNLPNFDVTGTPGTNPAWTAQNIGANGTQGLDSGTESDTDSDVTVSGANAGRTGTFNIVPGNNFPNIDAGIINWPLGNILPIRLVSFVASPKAATVELTWVVSTETNVANYEVEYSSNGVNYSSIGSRVATGNRTYSLVHGTPKQGINYYRLKVTDRDGKVSYSEVRKVNFGAAAGSVSIYPNPTSDVVNITVASGMINKAATITVIAMDGRVVASKQVAAVSQTEVIDVRKLASGKYILRISTNDNEVINKQVEVIR